MQCTLYLECIYQKIKCKRNFNFAAPTVYSSIQFTKSIFPHFHQTLPLILPWEGGSEDLEEGEDDVADALDQDSQVNHGLGPGTNKHCIMN